MKSIDTKDQRILALLRSDSRMPLKAIAGHVGLARSSVQERIRKLEESGAISGYTIRELARAAGETQAYLWIRTQSAICARIAPQIVRISEVRYCRSIAGEQDMVVYLEADSPGRIAEIRAEIAEWEGVTGVDTHLVLKDWT